MNMHLAFADRKNGLVPVAYDHPDLEPILGETYGIIVFQEAVMRIATDLCGFTLAEADELLSAGLVDVMPATPVATVESCSMGPPPIGTR